MYDNDDDYDWNIKQAGMEFVNDVRAKLREDLAPGDVTLYCEFCPDRDTWVIVPEFDGEAEGRGLSVDNVLSRCLQPDGTLWREMTNGDPRPEYEAAIREQVDMLLFL